MAAGHNVCTEEELRAARNELVAVLRGQNPSFLRNHSEPQLKQRHPEIAEAFTAWLRPTAFTLEIVPLPELGPSIFEGRWQHNGADFVGFKQPPAAGNRVDATILACAALLRNDWCRARLPRMQESARSAM